MERLRKLRANKGYTQQAFANKVGVSQAYINQIENCKRQPSMKTFVKIAKVLNVQLEELL
jgi:transcriptional regulator with XRE-family HTH domain